MDFLRGTHDERVNARPILLGACFGWGLVLGVILMNLRAERAQRVDSVTPEPPSTGVAPAVPPVADADLPDEPYIPVGPAVAMIPEPAEIKRTDAVDFDPAGFPAPYLPQPAIHLGLTARTMPIAFADAAAAAPAPDAAPSRPALTAEPPGPSLQAGSPNIVSPGPAAAASTPADAAAPTPGPASPPAAENEAAKRARAMALQNQF